MFSDFYFYLTLGFEHIVNRFAYDHLLFVLALCAGRTPMRQLLWLTAAFTIGHSVTLALSTLSLLKIRPDFVEWLIPFTIIFTALGNLLIPTNVPKYEKSNLYLKLSLALLFGLIHGLGFSNYLKSMLPKDANILPALFGFNIGVEIGQILIIFIYMLISFAINYILRINRNIWETAINLLIIFTAGRLVFNLFAA